MIENKKIPEIRFKGFTEDWVQRKVEEIGDNFSTGTLGYADLYDDGKYKCVLYGDLYTKFNERIFNVKSRTDKEATKVEINDILFPTSTTVDNISLIAPSCVNQENIRVGGDLFGIRPYRYIDGNFVSYCINNFMPIKYSFAKQAQGLTIVHLQYSSIKNEKLMIPTLDEQRRMSQLFISIDNLITLHQRKYEKLVNVKKSLLEKMFPKNSSKIPEIRFKGFTGDWEQRKLLEIASYRNGKAHENDIDDKGKFIVINSKFVSTDGEIKKFSNKQNVPLLKNEIAFVLSDVPNGKALAKTFLVDKTGKYTLNQRIAGITPHPNVNPKYLAITMSRNKYFLQFDDGVKQTNLSINDMEKYENYYPNKLEQDQIGNLFQNIDNLITLHQRKLEKLNNIKKSILDKMFV